jgi:pimeloyl-ACP methyl ester carboxylesterase
LLVCACAALVCACQYLRTAEIPMQAEYFHYRDANSTLVVLLHGLGGKPANFLKYGTLDQVLECNPDVNVVGVDGHFGYYREGIIIDRLHRDVIQPARAAGVSRIWLAGVSLGGLASLDYRQQYPGEIEAVILMAPYLGEWDELQAYLADPAAIRERVNPSFAGLWDSLVELQPKQAGITLAYGDADGFHPELQWLASRLDPQQVITAPGGHRWTVWQGLWPQALKRSGLCG